MVEKDRVMTLFIKQQNVSAILSPGCEAGGNIYYNWKAEEFLIEIWLFVYYYQCISVHIDSVCMCDLQVQV